MLDGNGIIKHTPLSSLLFPQKARTFLQAQETRVSIPEQQNPPWHCQHLVSMF